MENVEGAGLTAFGEWAERQPRGVYQRAQEVTRLAYSTVWAARTKLVSTDTAIKLQRFTRGEVKASEMVRSRSAVAK